MTAIRLKDLQGAECLPFPKDIQIVNRTHAMGLDGKIVCTSESITYDKEAEAYNACLSDMQDVGVEIDVEEVVESILKKWREYDRLNVQMDSVEEAESLAQAIAQANVVRLTRVK